MSPSDSPTRLHRLRTWGLGLFAGLNLWAALAGLGLVPTAAAVIAFIVASDFGAWVPFILVLSLLLNVVLSYLAIRGWRAARAAQASYDGLTGGLSQLVMKGDISWLPNADGRPLTQETFERIYAAVIAACQESIGADAELDVAWVSLTQAQVVMRGWSPAARKAFWAAGGEDGQAAIGSITRGNEAPQPRYGLTWRDDPTWSDLLRLSWAAEVPFSGSVMLTPRREWGVQPDGTLRERAAGEGLWTITYHREVDSVSEPAREYILRNGDLIRAD